MNKKLREKLAAINAKKAEVKQLVDDNEIEKAEAAKAELDKMQSAFNLLLSMEDEEEEEATAKAAAGKMKEPEGSGKKPLTLDRLTCAIVNALGAKVGRRKMSAEDRQIIKDSMTEGSEEDGGLTVPKDIRTKIKELRRSSDNLEQYVNVEKVDTMSGSRTIEKDADTTPWDEIDEEGEYDETQTPQFVSVPYKITKKGGKMLASLELMADTAENIMSYLTKWIAKKTRATRNAKIINCMETITTGHEVAISDLDDLKDIFNTMLDPSIAASSGVWTNQDGYNWLDKLKDEEGRYVLQPNPADKTTDLLFGRYPVHKLSNKALKTAVDSVQHTNTYPIYCGDLKEAVTLFDREYMTVESSKEAGTVWDKDQLAIKVRDRFDVQPVDKSAIIKGKVTISTAG